MIPNLFGLKGVAIASAVFLVIGTGIGWKGRDALCDAAKAKADIAALRVQLDARDKAAKQDQAKAQQAAETIQRLEETTRELETKIAAGECMSAADVDQLRRLWVR